MLQELQNLYDELQTAIAALGAQTRLVAPDGAALSEARRKLTRASSRRSRFLEESVYPDLFRKLGQQDIEAVRNLRSEAVAIRMTSAEHVADWPLAAVLEDWTGYQRASRVMVASMRARIEIEQRVLYPLLREIGSRDFIPPASMPLVAQAHR